MRRLKVVFFGTPDFSVPALEMLHNHSLVEVSAVVTMPDRPAGRGQELKSPPVADFAKANGIKLFQTEKFNIDEDAKKFCRDNEIDAFIVLAFAQFLNTDSLEIPKLGCFNIHTSLLPKYRGAAPIQHALLNGDTSTGVSIQKMVKKMDAGDLVLSQPVSISPTETGGELYTRLKFQAALSLSDFIRSLARGDVNYTPQDESKVCFAPTLQKEDGIVDFENTTFETFYNRLRALKPWPGTFFFMAKKRIKIFEIEKSSHSLRAGEFKVIKNELHVGCLDGSARLLELQMEGKKVCKDHDFLSGIRNNKDFSFLF